MNFPPDLFIDFVTTAPAPIVVFFAILIFSITTELLQTKILSSIIVLPQIVDEGAK